MQSKLFVRNLSFTTDDSELSQLFAEFGSVVSARVAVDRESGRSRGFGFVEMKSQESAQEAIAGLDSTDFGGRKIHVAVSEPRERSSDNRYW